jgi:prevent-host-death family protein
MPFSVAKAHLSELADRVENEHERILVTRNGRPSFVLLSPDDLESLEETLEILRDRALVESITTSRREAAEGQRASLRDSL